MTTNPDLDAEILRRWNAGMDGTQIGAELGITRNVVAGRVSRMRGRGIELQERQTGVHTPRQLRPRTRIRYEPPVREARSAEPVKLKHNGASLLDLQNVHCRWPLGDDAPYLFCAVPDADVTGGVPYCGKHARIAFRQRGEPA